MGWDSKSKKRVATVATIREVCLLGSMRKRQREFYKGKGNFEGVAYEKLERGPAFKMKGILFAFEKKNPINSQIRVEDQTILLNLPFHTSSMVLCLFSHVPSVVSASMRAFFHAILFRN